jgi:hypothetical protein
LGGNRIVTQRNYDKNMKSKGRAWWLTLAIPATGEAEIGSLQPSLGKKLARPHLNKPPVVGMLCHPSYQEARA